ncbi:MAG: UbiA family prenyltransferase, partial [Peptostreptococcaceae bacterium]
MSLKAYISFVELPTKIASVIPFILGTVYTMYRYGEINAINLIIMFTSMITFDMATTGINNYCDYQNELKHTKEKYDGRNPMHVYNISNKVGLLTIFTLLSIGVISGIILVLKTNLLILAIGVLCYFVGIFYTFGPIPISRMPLGEIFSGVFMGLLITFLTIYVTIHDKGYFGLYINEYNLSASFNLMELVVLGLISIPLIIGIANIMLANNICDLEDDIKVQRFTLPYYIGKENAIKIFKYNYYIGYIAVLLAIIMGILPKSAVLFLASILV